MSIVDRDSLKHQIIETYEYEFPTASGAFDEFVTKIIPNIINNAPTVDAVEVVRCKDCKKYQLDSIFHIGFCDGKRRKDNDFCSYGERRTDNGQDT